jgi:hypothetical protein
MLIPNTLLRVLEYDAVYVITPTSRHGHFSDTVLATVEMLVENDQTETIEFPFTVLSSDAGSGADPESIRPRVTNGSRAVALAPVDDVDEDALARLSAERARAAGHTDADVRAVEAWTRTALQKAERVHRGRTKLRAGERRRIVLQQRLRVRPDAARAVTYSARSRPRRSVRCHRAAACHSSPCSRSRTTMCASRLTAGPRGSASSKAGSRGASGSLGTGKTTRCSKSRTGTSDDQAEGTGPRARRCGAPGRDGRGGQRWSTQAQGAARATARASHQAWRPSCLTPTC